LTFDDGYCNNLQHALPVLQDCGFTATCYVMSQLLGKTNVWDIENGVKQADLMTVTQIRQWAQAGMEIGAHTQTHCKLPRMSDQDAVREISACKLELADMLGQSVAHFCYPYGGFDDSAVNCAVQAGYETATTTVRGRVHSAQGRDLLTLPRVLVSRTTTCLHLLLKCLTRYEDRRSTSAKTLL
jgi:peptidoglycan/xylan/chitin deacetylase (PgdA/CDA1 family)